MMLISMLFLVLCAVLVCLVGLLWDDEEGL